MEVPTEEVGVTLAEVFQAGHRVATIQGTPRYVVFCPAPPAPAGYWLVQAKAMPAVVYSKQVAVKDLAGSLGATDMQASHWTPDATHCWCPACSDSRKMFETQSD